MKHILIVQNNRLLNEIIHSQFQPFSSEFTLTFAGTLSAAHHLINERIPDLAFVNPRLSGGRANALLPERMDEAKFPIIAILDDAQLINETLQFGVLDYVLMPTAPAIDMVWAARRTLREWDCIVQKRRAEEQLRYSEGAFRAILESITEGIVLVRSDNTIQIVNQYVEAVFGYGRDELIGQGIDVLLPATYRHRHRHLRETYMQNPTPRAMGIGRELLAQRKDGRTFPVEVSLAPVVIFGDPCIMCVIVDITQRLKSQEDLRRSEERFRSLVNAMDDIIYTLDRQQCHTGVYGRWVENSGLTPEIFLGRSSAEIFGTENVKIHEAANEQALAGESVTYHWSTVTNGQAQHYQTRVSPMFGADGQVVGVVGIGRDITELQSTKQELEARVSERTTKLNLANQLLIVQVSERELSEVREREQRVLLESIHEIALAVNSSLNLDDILDRIVNMLDRVVPHDQINITLVNSAGLGVVVRAKGYTPELAKIIPQGEFVIEQRLLLSELLQAGCPLILDAAKNYPVWHKPPREALRSVIGTPIIADSKVLGFILLSSQHMHFFTQEDTERLGVFVNHAALAIRNAQLYEQAGELAVIKDRQRLARDLHDAVTQTLFSAGVVSDALIRLWDTQPQKVKERLIYLNQLTQGALAEMRTLLIELRPQAIAATDFDELARHLIISFYNRSGIQPQFNIELTNQKTLSTEVKEVLYRILQEALSNIIKHARAKAVEISLHCHEDAVQLNISDDGTGFESSKIQTGTHMGLKIMQERADSIGATLTITSNEGMGTKIGVQWRSANE